MATRHAEPNEVINVRPLGAALSDSRTQTLINTSGLEVIRLVLSAGKEIATHKARGAITVQCLEGRVSFSASGTAHILEAGQLLYLEADAPHSVRAIQAASLLLTIRLN
ncbi:MAG: cupin domain-containing protein [Maioricimonas sp. JB049]